MLSYVLMLNIIFFATKAQDVTFPTAQTCTPPPSEESVGNSDYYWRDYTGLIPSDAIPGGFDISGQVTYIGQIYDKRVGILPAIIRTGSASARTSWAGKAYSLDYLVKILCSRNQHKYRWLPTRNEQTHLLTECHLVIGGTELGYLLNIGRVKHELETVVGKVFAHHTPYRGLSIPYKEGEATYQSYEILTYDCNMNQYCQATENGTKI